MTLYAASSSWRCRLPESKLSHCKLCHPNNKLSTSFSCICMFILYMQVTGVIEKRIQKYFSSCRLQLLLTTRYLVSVTLYRHHFKRLGSYRNSQLVYFEFIAELYDNLIGTCVVYCSFDGYDRGPQKYYSWHSTLDYS